MAASSTREQLYRWLHGRVDSILIDDPVHPPLPVVRADSLEAAILGKILRILPALASWVAARGRYCSTVPLPEEARPAETKTGLALRLAAEAEQSAEDLAWLEVGELAGFLHQLCRFLELPALPEAPSSFTFNWRDEVAAGFQARRAATVALLAQHENASELCWVAFRSAGALVLHHWSDVLGELVQHLTLATLRVAMPLRSWSSAILMRGRYLAALRAARPLARDIDGERRASGPRHLWAGLGSQLARAHAAETGALPARHRFAASDAARVVDIAILYRGDTAEEWQAWVYGYSHHDAASAVAISRMDAAVLRDERRPAEHGGIERPAGAPHSFVALCTHILHHTDGVSEQLTERADALGADEDLETRALAAAVLGCESAGICDETRDRALGTFYEAAQLLYNEQRFAVVARVVPPCMLYLKRLLVGSNLATIEGLHYCALAQLADPPSQSIYCCRAAGASSRRRRLRSSCSRRDTCIACSNARCHRASAATQSRC